MKREADMSRLIRRHTAASVVSFVIFTTNDLSAQTAQRCDVAARIVSSGRVSEDQRSAYLTLSRCGAVGANAFAAGIAKLAPVTDTIRLDTTVLADGTIEFTVGCGGGFVSEPAHTLVATPLPSNVADQIRATLASLVATQTAPKQVRAAAACLTR